MHLILPNVKLSCSPYHPHPLFHTHCLEAFKNCFHQGSTRILERAMIAVYRGEDEHSSVTSIHADN